MDKGYLPKFHMRHARLEWALSPMTGDLIKSGKSGHIGRRLPCEDGGRN